MPDRSHLRAGDRTLWPILRGTVVPLVTPYDASGRISASRLHRLIDFLVDAGVHGVYPGGTTGEGPLLSLKERVRLAEVAVSAASGRVPVVMQVGSASTDETIRLAQHAMAARVDAVAVVTPWYYRYSEDAIRAHYLRVADAVAGLPMVIYNIPQHTGNPMSASLISSIADQAGNVIAVKDSSGDLVQIAELVAISAGRFQVLVGNDELILPALVLGASGTVAGNANLFPHLFVQLCIGWWSSDLAAAQLLQQRISTVARALGRGNLGLFKALLARRGLPVGAVRRPLEEPGEAEITACVKSLSAAGVEEWLHE